MSTCVVLFAPRSGADLGSYRTERVRSGFDANKTAGQWYEVLVVDPAQVGASCQRYVNAPSDEGFKQAFECRYGAVPFSQTYIYESQGRGLYTAYLSGAKAVLQLPTVIVDAFEERDGRYTWLLQYAETSILGVPVRELRVSARTPDASAQAATALLDTFVSVGIDRSFVQRARPVDHRSCKPGTTPADAARDGPPSGAARLPGALTAAAARVLSALTS